MDSPVDSPAIAKSAQSQCELKMLMPNGRFIFFWNIVLLLLMLYSLFATVYSYLVGTLEPVSLFETVVIVSNVAVLIDIVFNFRTGYIDPRHISRVIAIPGCIVRRYLRSWFLVDFLASGILGMVLAFIMEDSSSSMLRVLRVLRLLTLLRIFKVWRSVKIVGKYKCDTQTYTIVTEQSHLEIEAEAV